MSTSEPTIPKELLSPLGSSGFPFQTAAAAVIRSVGPFAIEEEVAWQDSDGVHRFLDIVASIGQITICIECKALRGENLVFLLPRGRGRSQTADVHAVHLARFQDSTRRPAVMHGVSQTAPVSQESVYCIAIGKTSGEGRLIEREAQPLVRGAEEYARDRCRQFRPDDCQPQSLLCIPVLLTTARLFVAEYDPLSISLEDGIYRAREEHIRRVPFVRFAKQFTAHGAERTRLRTVIVAHSAYLRELVCDLGNVIVAPWVESWVKVYDSMDPDVHGRRR